MLKLCLTCFQPAKGSIVPQMTGRQLLRIKDFKYLLLSRTFFYLGLQIQAVIVGWHIYDLTKDPLYLGLIGLTEAIPAILSAFIAGPIVDSSRPYLTHHRAVLAVFLNTTILFFLIYAKKLAGIEISEQVQLLAIFIAIFISGVARSFASPSVVSMIPMIIPRENLSSASAFTTSIYQIASISGPAIGGIIFGYFGVEVAFFLPVVLSCLSFLFPFLISEKIKNIKNHFERESFWSSITEGLKFSLKHKILFPAMALDMFCVLFGGAVAVLPMFSDQIFNLGPTGLGFLRASPAVGSLIVSVWLALNPLKEIYGKHLNFVVFGWATSTIFFALTQNFYIACFWLFLSGAFDGVSMVIRGTIVQMFTPDHMRGRVSSVNSVFISSSNEIGAFESGIAAKYLGLVPSVLMGGILSLLIVFIVDRKAVEFRATKIA